MHPDAYGKLGLRVDASPLEAEDCVAGGVTEFSVEAVAVWGWVAADVVGEDVGDGVSEDG